MLGVKEISADAVHHKMRHDLGQHQHLPAAKNQEHRADGKMDHHRQEAVEMFEGMVNERLDTHPMKKHEKVTKHDGQRMTDK